MSSENKNKLVGSKRVKIKKFDTKWTSTVNVLVTLTKCVRLTKQGTFDRIYLLTRTIEVQTRVSVGGMTEIHCDRSTHARKIHTLRKACTNNTSCTGTQHGDEILSNPTHANDITADTISEFSCEKQKVERPGHLVDDVLVPPSATRASLDRTISPSPDDLARHQRRMLTPRTHTVSCPFIMNTGVCKGHVSSRYIISPRI